MAEPEPSQKDLIKSFAEAISKIVDLHKAIKASPVVALVVLYFYRKKIVEVLDFSIPWWGWLAITLLLLSLQIYSAFGKSIELFKRLTRHSRLLRPKALWLKASNPEHLIGREDDIERLPKLCGEFSLIFIEGESGAGKSALLQSGLGPELSQTSSFLPIYLDVWGEDWEKGPRQSLCDSLWASLSTEDRKALTLEEAPGAENLVTLLGSLRARLGRTPILLLDQFDDYQSRHQWQFIPPKRKTWLPVEELVQNNAFWSDLRTLLMGGSVRCVIATRADAAGGLYCVQLVSPRIYPLARLRTIDVGPLLTKLTESGDPAAPVVEFPEAGWERLKERLARDLDQDGTILPVQMRMAFRGLAALRALTPRAYEREGGLRGIEAAHIEQQITNTALNSGLSKPQVLKLLLALVDREKRKTLPKTEGKLVQAVLATDPTGDVKAIKKGVTKALEFLQDREIVRRRLDPDTRGHVWLLDHDYLTNGILEAERRANRWLSLLQEKSRAYQEAGANYWRKWWALLSPLQQIGVAAQFLRRRLDYGQYRPFALKSLLRWTPYLILVTLGLYGWNRVEESRQAQRDHDRARAILSAQGTVEQWDKLWELATSSDAVRFSFLDQALADPGDCRRIDAQAENVLQTIVGLDPIRKRVALEKIISTRDFNHVLSNAAYVSAASMLLASSSKPDQRSLASPFLIKALEKSSGSDALSVLAAGLKAVPGTIEPDVAKKAVASILAAIEKAYDPYALNALAEGLKAVLGKIEPDVAKKAVASIIAAIEKTNNPDTLSALAEALKAVPDTIESDVANKAVASILAAFEKTNNPDAIRVLAEALKAVPGTIEPAIANKAVASILAAFESTNDPDALRSLAAGLKAVPGKIEPDVAKKAVASIIAAIESTNDPDALRSLAAGLKAVLGKIEPDDAKKAVASILAAIGKTNDPYALSVLAAGLKAVPGTIEPDVAKKAFSSILDAIEKPNDPLALSVLAEGLKAVLGKIEPDVAKKAVASILAAIEKTNNPFALNALAEGLKAVAGKIEPDVAKKAVASILAAIEKTNDPDALRVLAAGLKAVPGTIEPDVAKKAVASIIAAIEKTNNSLTLSVLAAGLKAVPGEIEPDDAKRALASIVVAIEKDNDPYSLDLLAEALKAVPGEIDLAALINLAKFPNCVADLRIVVLEIIERQNPPAKFGGDVWKMVEWAQEKHPELDLTSPPRRSPRP